MNTQANPSPRDQRVGDLLHQARKTKGLELNDIAEITHVRKEYLKALEESRYDDLPEDIYAKNFLKLYAQTVGLQDSKMLELYKRERRLALGASPDKPNTANTQGQVKTTTNTPRPNFRLANWLPGILLVTVVVALSVLAFNSLFGFNANRPNTSPSQTGTSPIVEPVTETAPETTLQSSQTTAETSTSPAPVTEAANPTVEATNPTTEATAAEATNPAATSSGELSQLTLITEPPGAVVSVDGFLLGESPLNDYLLTPGDKRSLRVELPGYTPYEAVVNLSESLRLNLVLTPLNSPAPSQGNEANANLATTADNQITLSISDTTWLEAYQSTQRGTGETLIYTTLQPGQSYTFDLPVYLHVGNAAAVQVVVNGQDMGSVGSSGEVVSRAFQ